MDQLIPYFGTDINPQLLSLSAGKGCHSSHSSDLKDQILMPLVSDGICELLFWYGKVVQTLSISEQPVEKIIHFQSRN